MNDRFDSDGLVWSDPVREKKKGGGYIGRKPALPEELNWNPHREFPRLDSAKVLSIDIETYDPDLKEKGPGPRRGGYIVGIAVATEDDSWYFPMSHDRAYDPSGLNRDRDKVLRWAKNELTRPGIPKIGANLLYDLDFLWEAGVTVPGPYHDIQVAEPLIDENSFSYSLDNLAKKYLGVGKRSNTLYEWLSLAYGGKPTAKDQGGNIYRAPPDLVGEYAIGDVEQPRAILQKQKHILAQEELLDLFSVERRLMPLLLAMRRRGVAVNRTAASQLDDTLMEKAAELRAVLEKLGIDPWSGDTIARWCDSEKIPYPTIKETGNPSFRAAWLENHPHEVMNHVHQVRRLEKHAGTFIQGVVFRNEVNGRIHTQFHQLRGDEYGTVSGRFSSSHPNLQNIPARDEELGPLIRSLFIPEDGEIWISDDWSQIEFRLLVHYGRGESADITRQRYIQDPETDFHKFVAELTGIDRKPAKNINFGLVYGMGEPTMAANLGRTLEEVAPMFKQYHRELPFIKQIYRLCDDRARERGFIKTILGRRRRFNRWQTGDWKQARKDGTFSYQDAVEKYGERKVVRALTHKALNALLQGGAADIMKKAMVDIWEAGICDVLGAPLLTVHDELNWSSPQTPEAIQAHDEARLIMENCVPLRLPLLCDTGSGANWGEAK